MIIALTDSPDRLLDFAHLDLLRDGWAKDHKFVLDSKLAACEMHGRLVTLMKQADQELVITNLDTTADLKDAAPVDEDSVLDQELVIENAPAEEPESAMPAPVPTQPSVSVAPRPVRSQTMETVSSQLTKLEALREAGLLTEEEFHTEKARVLAG